MRCLFLISSALLISAYCLAAESEVQRAYREGIAGGCQWMEAGDDKEAARCLESTWEVVQRSSDISEGDKQVLRYLLAYACFQSDQWKKTAALLIHPASLKERFLLALAYSKLEEHSLALEQFTEISEQPLSEEYLALQSEILFAWGLCHFSLKQYDAASKKWESIPSTQSLYSLAQIYLSRIEMEGLQWEKAKTRLKSLSESLAGGDPLHYEVAFWQGEIAFREGLFLEAITLFKKSIPPVHAERVEWFPELLARLVRAHLQAAQQSSPLAQSKNLLAQAEIFADQLRTLRPDEDSAAFLLAECYLRQWQLLGEAHIFEKFEGVLRALSLSSSLETHAGLLALKIEAAADYQQKLFLIDRLLNPEFASTSHALQGWKLKGFTELEEAKRLLAQGPSERGGFLLDQALHAFENALKLGEKGDSSLKTQLVKGHTETALLRNGKEALKTSFEHLEEAMASVSSAELLYLKGSVAYRLSDHEKGARWEERAEKAWKRLLDLMEEGAGIWRERGLFSLATLHFHQQNFSQAQLDFLELQRSFPQASMAGEALYFASQCAERLQQDSREIKGMRRKVWTEYPHSSCAAEAYFLTYSMSQYLQEEGAIRHLSAMETLYPDSPWRIPAHYLQGLSFRKDSRLLLEGGKMKQDPQRAIEAFHTVETLFDTLFAQQRIPQKHVEVLASIRNQAKLQRALTNVAIGQGSKGVKKALYLEYALDVLKELLAENESSKNGSFLEEAKYALGHVYVQLGEDAFAHQIFQEMLEKYQTAKISRGLLLSKVWKSLGQLKFKEKKYPLALQAFGHAEEALRGKHEYVNQKLELWTLQSDCHREMKEWEAAMRFLSKVINDQEASSLRLKAMLLRAEVYEEQGRPELAQRQLEALAKKGGAWGAKAKERLENIYGFKA